MIPLASTCTPPIPLNNPCLYAISQTYPFGEASLLCHPRGPHSQPGAFPQMLEQITTPGPEYRCRALAGEIRDAIEHYRHQCRKSCLNSFNYLASSSRVRSRDCLPKPPMSTPVSRPFPFFLFFHSFRISIKNAKHPLKSCILLIMILPKDLELLDSDYPDNPTRRIPKRINAALDAACKVLSVFYSWPLLGLPELLLQKFSYGV